MTIWLSAPRNCKLHHCIVYINVQMANFWWKGKSRVKVMLIALLKFEGYWLAIFGRRWSCDFIQSIGTGQLDTITMITLKYKRPASVKWANSTGRLQPWCFFYWVYPWRYVCSQWRNSCLWISFGHRFQHGQ